MHRIHDPMSLPYGRIRGEFLDETFIIDNRQPHLSSRSRLQRNLPSFPAQLRRLDPSADQTVIFDSVNLRNRNNYLTSFPAHPSAAMLDDDQTVIVDSGDRNNGGGRLSGDGEEQRKSSEIWRYLNTGNYECGVGCEFCAVCQSEFEDGDKLGKLPCGHNYHAPCIHTWLQEKNVCPVCKRTAIPELEIFF